MCQTPIARSCGGELDCNPNFLDSASFVRDIQTWLRRFFPSTFLLRHLLGVLTRCPLPKHSRLQQFAAYVHIWKLKVQRIRSTLSVVNSLARSTPTSRSMRLSMSSAYKLSTVQPMVNFQGLPPLNIESFFRSKDKVVFVAGPTGTGKSRLAIDIATSYHAEVVNCDKMQVYKGLDVVTNKVTKEECRGVPHHLLGTVDPDANFTSDDFRHHASLVVESIVDSGRLPIIAGGSNSFIEALANDDPEFRLRYDCCFLWVDVSLPVLYSFVSERVDRMVKAGLVQEVRAAFDPENRDYSQGIRRAIGVPELDQYLRNESTADPDTRAKLLASAIAKIKENTCKLAYRQLQKIHRLNGLWNWNMHRIDATEVFLRSGEEADEAWEKLVAGPSAMIVDQFLYEHHDHHHHRRHMTTIVPAPAPAVTIPMPAMAAAAATR